MTEFDVVFACTHHTWNEWQAQC